MRWTYGGTAWSNAVPLLDDEGAARTYRFSRRERPHLVLGADGAITALSTGVQYGRGSPVAQPGEDACYTLLQPVAHSARQVATAD